MLKMADARGVGSDRFDNVNSEIPFLETTQHEPDLLMVVYPATERSDRANVSELE